MASTKQQSLPSISGLRTPSSPWGGDDSRSTNDRQDGGSMSKKRATFAPIETPPIRSFGAAPTTTTTTTGINFNNGGGGGGAGTSSSTSSLLGGGAGGNGGGINLPTPRNAGTNSFTTRPLSQTANDANNNANAGGGGGGGGGFSFASSSTTTPRFSSSPASTTTGIGIGGVVNTNNNNVNLHSPPFMTNVQDDGISNNNTPNANALIPMSYHNHNSNSNNIIMDTTPTSNSNNTFGIRQRRSFGGTTTTTTTATTGGTTGTNKMRPPPKSSRLIDPPSLVSDHDFIRKPNTSSTIAGTMDLQGKTSTTSTTSSSTTPQSSLPFSSSSIPSPSIMNKTTQNETSTTTKTPKAAASSSLLSSTDYSLWVTVYGFTNQQQYKAIQSKFQSFGTITSCYPSSFGNNNINKQGRGGGNSSSILHSNWVCFKYESELEKEKAVCQHGSLMDATTKGSSFSTRMMMGIGGGGSSTTTSSSNDARGKDVMIVGVMRMNVDMAVKLGLKNHIEFGSSGVDHGSSGNTIFQTEGYDDDDDEDIYNDDGGANGMKNKKGGILMEEDDVLLTEDGNGDGGSSKGLNNYYSRTYGARNGGGQAVQRHGVDSVCEKVFKWVFSW